MTYQPTAKQFDDIIDEFLLEMDYATPERIIQLDGLITLLLEEKEARGL